MPPLVSLLLGSSHQTAKNFPSFYELKLIVHIETMRCENRTRLLILQYNGEEKSRFDYLTFARFLNKKFQSAILNEFIVKLAKLSIKSWRIQSNI